MSNIIVAVTLGILTLIRLTTLRGRNSYSAFAASALATAGFIIYVEQVYNVLDPLLGGGNRAALLMVLLVSAAFWQLHKSTSSATLAANPIALRRKLRQGVGIWIATCLLMVAGFVASDTPTTSQSLIHTYGHETGIAVLFGVFSCFIVYVAADVSIASFRNLSRMSPLFRAGFLMIGVGCTGALALLFWRNIAQLTDPGYFQQPHIAGFYGAVQVIVVLLVSIGLSLSPLVVIARFTRSGLKSRWYLYRLVPLWNGVTAGNGDMILNKEHFGRLDCLKPDPLSLLHRRVTEIRDCQRVGDASQADNATVAGAEKLLLIT